MYNGYKWYNGYDAQNLHVLFILQVLGIKNYSLSTKVLDGPWRQATLPTTTTYIFVKFAQ